MSLRIPAPARALALFLCSAPLVAQVPEVEPNNPCSAAQDLEGVAVPFFVPGHLDSSSEPDVDFYRVAAEPGAGLQVDLEGLGSGMGTLGDPYLGFFNSACELVVIDDDSGGNLNSRLFVTVPGDGIAIFGVTRCCDWEFAGGGEGTYTLTVSEASVIASIGGRVVDAETLQLLPGDAPPFASATLWGCSPYGCDRWINSQPVGPDGRFAFSLDAAGQPIPVGAFLVVAYSEAHEPASAGPFEVGEDESYDLGDLLLAPFQVIGAVTGRIVDEDTGSPLPGSSPPFARVDLDRCDDWGCYPVVGGLPADDGGNFRIDGLAWGLSPGTYRLAAFADDYYPWGSEPVYIGDDEVLDLGDIGLAPLPIGYGEVVGCDFLPIGGQCEFSVQVTYRGAGRYRGEAWAIARYFSVNYPNLATRFQIGRMGAQNPNPQRLNLRHGQTATVSFRLDVPGSTPEGTSLCVTGNVGRDPAPQFDAAGERLLFCAVAQPGGLARLSAKESRHHLVKAGSGRK